MVLETMQWYQASTCVDVGYTELFCIHAVTSVSFWTCDSVLGTLWSSTKQIKALYIFDWELGISLPTIQENGASSYR